MLNNGKKGIQKTSTDIYVRIAFYFDQATFLFEQVVNLTKLFFHGRVGRVFTSYYG